MFLKVLLALISCSVHHCVSESVPCSARAYGPGGIVCVCNATYCDTTEPIVRLPVGQMTQYSTTRKSALNKTIGKFEAQPARANVTFTVYRNVTYQTILGFGGAFTDAAGMNIMSLSESTQDNLLKSYFSSSGIEYNIGRVPMASCDFSPRIYSYDDHPMDFNLTHFELAQEDLKYKIPLIQRAQKMSSKNLMIFGSPWSAPAWMKTNDNMTGSGILIGDAGGKYYKTWANYFVRFLQEYEKHGISVWGLTAQNEPTTGFIPHFSFQTMGWTPEMQRDFIAQDLGPALHASGYSSVKLMILDDARILLPLWADNVFSNSDNKKYVSGIGVHWYEDWITPTFTLDITHKLFPDVFILATEASKGKKPTDYLGDWERGAEYAHSIIQDLSHWVTGWTDWNMALNMDGGPSWLGSHLDSPVVVNAPNGEFYKQPMFYALGHFSKFVVPGSKRIEVTKSSELELLEVVAFILPDKSVAMVVLNKYFEDVPFCLHDPLVGFFNKVLEARSIHTFIWWNE